MARAHGDPRAAEVCSYEHTCDKMALIALVYVVAFRVAVHAGFVFQELEQPSVGCMQCLPCYNSILQRRSLGQSYGGKSSTPLYDR